LNITPLSYPPDQSTSEVRHSGVLIDAWIYQPFNQVSTGAENQQLVTMAMLPNLPLFGGDPKDWPMFIQAFKSMVHDVFTSDAQRLAMLHSRLENRLRIGMSQVLTTPMAYRDALQELHRKYGHPHLVVRSYIRSLMELPSLRESEEVDEFAAKLHGAVTTLEAAGYGHELNSSVALAEIVHKLPPSMITRWGRKMHKLLPKVPTLRDLDIWIEEELMSTRNVRDMTRQLRRNPIPAPKPRLGMFQPTVNFIDQKPTEKDADQHPGNNKCGLCKLEPGHRLALCPKFISMEPTQRAQAVYDLKNCFRCLGRNHNSNECRKTDATCGVANCGQHHHTLLHGADRVARK
jgi:hypothetical protein